MASPAWLTATDHAFASGPVFQRPSNWLDAIRKTRSLRGARLLMAVWRQFEANGRQGDPLYLSLNSRLVNRNAREAVSIGSGCALRAIIRLEPNGRLTIGNDVYMGDGCIVSVMDNVSIGDGTLFAHGVQLFDNDTHPTDASDRVADFRKKLGHRLPRPIAIGHAPVTIGKRCWLGMNSIVMKGVSIGDDTIVASGSVVVKDLPAGVIAAGNPARPLRKIASEFDLSKVLSASSDMDPG